MAMRFVPVFFTPPATPLFGRHIGVSAAALAVASAMVVTPVFVRPEIDLTYTDTATSSSQQSTKTFTGNAIGAEAGDRYVIVAWGVADGNGTLNSATIGGVTAAVHVQANSSSGTCLAGFISALVPTGTTATVVLNFSSSNGRVSIDVYRVTGLENAGATSDTGTDIDSDPNSTTIDCPAGGIIIGIATNQTNGNNIVWTGLATRDSNAQAGDNGWYSAAHEKFTTAQTGRTVSSNQSSDTRSCMAVASWR